MVEERSKKQDLNINKQKGALMNERERLERKNQEMEKKNGENAQTTSNDVVVL